jgi:hypothetical protein
VRLVALLLAALLAGCSTTAAQRATEVAWADTGTTAVGLALGAAEANPVGLLGLAIKPMILAHADTLPIDEKVATQATVAAMWGGASANNLCIIGAIATGALALAPLCPMLGLAWGMNEWHLSQGEREYAAWCRTWIDEKPGNYCLPFKG